MKVLFLILNYKTYYDTIRLTDALYHSGLHDSYVLIVDNASPNESYSKLVEKVGGYEHVEVISSPENGGFAKGNNFGLRYAKKYMPQYVCIINNDVLFSMQTINNLCAWYEKLPSAGIISPIQLLPNGKNAFFRDLNIPTIWSDLLLYYPINRKQHYYRENTQMKYVQEVGVIPGAFMFIDYKKFLKLGFFDETTFLFCEERLLAKKMQLEGLKNYIILNETYLHAHSATINNEASQKKQRRMIFEGRCLYYRCYSKHPQACECLLKIAFYSKELLYKIVNR